MTHTLHRFGVAEDLDDDFLVLAMPARSLDARVAVQRQKEFLRLALRYDPVNIGDTSHGSWFRAERDIRPSVHWRRRSRPRPDDVLQDIDVPAPVTAVFDNYEALRDFIAALQEADLGLSINISALTSRAVECCASLGIPRHSVEYSLGFMGRTDRLPDDRTLRLSTMCGHGMIAHALAGKMMALVKAGRRTPEEASRTLARFCNCGAFNPSRAVRILKNEPTSHKG
jgi:hypothetical protein